MTQFCAGPACEPQKDPGFGRPNLSLACPMIRNSLRHEPERPPYVRGTCKMKALRFHARNDLRIEHLDEAGALAPLQVRVRNSFCGICGTDLHE